VLVYTEEQPSPQLLVHSPLPLLPPPLESADMEHTSFVGSADDEASRTAQEATYDKKKNAEILASKYTNTKRTIEIVSVTLFLVLLSISITRTLNIYFLRNIWVTLCACVLAMASADFFSGLFHWGADTWGTIDTPVFGAMIRSFREHHVAPVAICGHDWIEANGDNCMMTLPVVLLTACKAVNQTSLYELFVHNFLVMLVIWVALTNQIHKWSHTYRPPQYVTLMQSLGLIVSKKDHAVHHRNPFDKYYCITHGWLNPILGSINYWKHLETTVTFVTGAVAREDDMLWNGIGIKDLM